MYSNKLLHWKQVVKLFSLYQLLYPDYDESWQLRVSLESTSCVIH